MNAIEVEKATLDYEIELTGSVISSDKFVRQHDHLYPKRRDCMQSLLSSPICRPYVNHNTVKQKIRKHVK